MNQKFEAKMSLSVKIITVAVHLLVLCTTLMPFLSTENNKTSLIAAICIFLFMFLIFLLVFLLRPFQYIIDDELLIVRKYILPKKIPLNSIESVEPIELSQLKILFRVWASGGLWGWFGFFSTSSLKIINMQCTEKENLVLIKINNEKPLVLSPNDANSFCAHLNNQISNAK